MTGLVLQLSDFKGLEHESKRLEWMGDCESV